MIKHITIIIFLSTCFKAGAQKNYNYTLLNGFIANKVIEINSDTLVSIGLSSRPRGILFTTLNTQNEILAVDTFILPDAYYLSYHSTFGINYSNNKLTIVGSVIKDEEFINVLCQFGKDKKLDFAATINEDFFSTSFQTVNFESKRKYISGIIIKNTFSDSRLAALYLLKEDSTLEMLNTYASKGTFVRWGVAEMMPIQILTMEVGNLYWSIKCLLMKVNIVG